MPEVTEPPDKISLCYLPSQRNCLSHQGVFIFSKQGERETEAREAE